MRNPFKSTNAKETNWMNLLKEKYFAGISNVFLVTGNIGDYAVPGTMLIDYLMNELQEMKVQRVYSYNYSDDIQLKIGKLKEGETAPKGWKGMLQELVSTQEKIAYIVEFPEFLIGKANNGYMDDDTKKRLIDLQQLMNNRKFITSDNVIIFISQTRSDIHEMFLTATSRLFPIDIEFPSEQERLQMIRYLKETSSKHIRWEVKEEQLAQLTAGLSRLHIEDLYLMSEEQGLLSRELVMRRKEELIRKEYGEVIEIFDTHGYNLDQFAGQEHLKEYHREAVIAPILSGDTDIVPKGLLYAGPPGTGKTYFSTCFAGEAGINFVEFKMSKILDKYVGEAERNLEKAFNCFKSLAPVGVFIDEVDQALSRGDNDSNSVGRNMFGMFLAFLSNPEHRGKIIWIGATNYPNKLDEALKRAGRFDKKMAFLPPTRDERIEVFRIHLNKLKFETKVQDFDFLGDHTEGYTQAEIENVVVKALEVAKRQKKTSITDETIQYALDCMIPYQNEGIKNMTKIALDEVNDKEFLPKDYKERFKDLLG